MKRIGVLFPLWIASATLGSSDPVEKPGGQAALNPLDAPAGDAAAADPVEADPVEALIAALADEDYKTRLQASQDLWRLGERAMDALREAAEGEDPEAVHRAMELIGKIELHITPDTDPLVIELVERYVKAGANERPAIFRALVQASAWHQLLKLYAAEKDADLRERLGPMIQGIPGLAARERLLAGDPDGAREFLEMAQPDEANLLALADFHRVNGTWQAEMVKARVSEAEGAASWRYALHRVAGNLADAAAAATEAGDSKGAALMQLFGGDPLPWMKLKSEQRLHYSDLAIARWQGRTLGEEDFEPLTRMLGSRQRETRAVATTALMLLGNREAVEKAAQRTDSIAAFSYYQSLERVDEALAAFGIDPENPDFNDWFGIRLEALIDDPDLVSEAHEVAELAGFMEGRGMHSELASAMDGPLADLAAESRDGFQILLSTLTYQHRIHQQIPEMFRGRVRLWDYRRTSGLPGPALRAAITWAGDNEEHWDEIILAIFDGRPEVMELWGWLEELDSQSPREERLRALLALCDVGADSDQRRKHWLELAWRQIDEAQEDERRPLLERMILLADFHSDAANSLRALDQLDPHDREESTTFEGLFALLTAAERWNDAAELAVRQGEQEAAVLTASGHALIAGALRQAGREEEAAKHDRLAELLALGNPKTAATIAQSYAAVEDFENSSVWTARSAQWLSADLLTASELNNYAADLLHAGEWKKAAAVAEVASLIGGQTPKEDLQGGIFLLRSRLAADLPRAISLLESDRERAIQLLDSCHALFPCDGSLADDFFPIIRQAGLIAEHDAWFEKSWKLISENIRRSPDAHNSLNTAGWIASRSTRRLPEAQELLKKALALNPMQAAYLDTFAEIQFALGNRDEAVEWSGIAVNYEPGDPMIRKQRHRFKHAPLP